MLVLDQLERALSEGIEHDVIRDVLAFDQWPPGADVAVVLSIREDYLARLVARSQELEPGIPIVRLPPLGIDGARAAIVSPLTESRLAIEPELLDALLADLQRAAAAIGPEMGWGTAPAVYPPHLQLACSVLFETLDPGTATLTLAHYRKLGGFDAIVGEHLERVLDTELADGRDVIARDLFVALVTAANQRAMRSESELVAIVGAEHGAPKVTEVLEVLRSRGLLVRVRDAGGEPGWELVHDSLVPRVLAWIDRRDLARKRAIELVRYHLRRSRPETPSLLGRAELRELRPYEDAIVELEAEWKKRDVAEDAWTPARLVERSRQALRRRAATFASLIVSLLAVASIGMYRSHVEEVRAAAEDSLRSRDLGRFVLSLESFDLDAAGRMTPIAITETSTLAWDLHVPDPTDPAQPGPRVAGDLVIRGTPGLEHGALVEHVEAHGGPAFLVIRRRGCSPTTVPLRQLPGYARREHEEKVLHVLVPSCAASRADTIAIPAGPFIFGGVGEPPSQLLTRQPEFATERTIELPSFRIDRTEVTNAAFAVFASMSAVTGIAMPSYFGSTGTSRAREPRKPVTGIDWFEARAYCRFLGKELPSSEQWVKALRGGVRLLDGSENPVPRRNLPWGGAPIPGAVRINDGGELGAVDVGSSPRDVSPYGVVDLAGNVEEWTDTADRGSARITHGGNWSETTPATLVDFMALENPRCRQCCARSRSGCAAPRPTRRSAACRRSSAARGDR